MPAITLWISGFIEGRLMRAEQLDSSLRAVFYPAVTGWVLLGVWAYTLHLRVSRIKAHFDEASE